MGSPDKDKVVTKEERDKQIRDRIAFREEMNRRNRERAEASERFDIKAVIADGKRERLVYVEYINQAVPYKVLTVAEEAEIAKIQDTELQKLHTLHKWLSKADPSITLEQIQEMPTRVSASIYNSILVHIDFLLEASMTKSSNNG